MKSERKARGRKRVLHPKMRKQAERVKAGRVHRDARGRFLRRRSG